MVILAVRRIIARLEPDTEPQKPWLFSVKEITEELGRPWNPKLTGWRLGTLRVDTRKTSTGTFAYLPKHEDLLDRITWTGKIGSLWGNVVKAKDLREAQEVIAKKRREVMGDPEEQKLKMLGMTEKKKELARVIEKLREEIRQEEEKKREKGQMLCYNENYATRSDPSYPSGTPPEDKDASGVGRNDAVCVHAEDTEQGASEPADTGAGGEYNSGDRPAGD